MANKRSDEAWLRAEANFKKKQQRTEEGEKVWGEHLAAGKAADTNRAKLKAQRLARDATQSEGPGKTTMEALVKETKEREVLPTHRQVPTKSSSKPTKRPR
jgi:hypothetical protein